MNICVSISCCSSIVHMQQWYVYIVRCRHGSLYTGIATDVDRRFAEHQANKGAKYLRGRGPLKLVFKKQIGTRELALKAEGLVKRLPKIKKEQLIEETAASGRSKSVQFPG